MQGRGQSAGDGRVAGRGDLTLPLKFAPSPDVRCSYWRRLNKFRHRIHSTTGPCREFGTVGMMLLSYPECTSDAYIACKVDA